MEITWQFLIQKDGDRSWLPLETPDVEILEGRYRVVARSNRIDTPVEIRISHQTPPSEFPPKRRVQKRSNRTSAEGLMVVTPFMRFKPGIWEMRCVGDVTTDHHGEIWQEFVRLQVLPIDEEIDEEVEFPQAPTVLSPPNTTAEETEPETTTPKSDRSDSNPSEISPGDLNQDSSTTVPPDPINPVPTEEVAAQIAPSVRLNLDRQTYIVNAGERFTLSGRIEADTDIDGESIVTGQLHIGLRNPENGKLLAEVRQPFSQQKLPVPFSCQVDIPLQSNTSLILGEVNIYGEAASSEDSTPVQLATASFSITADVTELMQKISDNMGESELLELSRESALKNNLATIDEAFLNIVETLKNPEPISFQKIKKPAIPPKIDLPEPNPESSRLTSVEFPVFSSQNQFVFKQQQNEPSSTEDAESNDAVDESEPETLESREDDPDQNNVIDFEKKIQERGRHKDRQDRQVNRSPEIADQSAEQETPASKSSPLDRAFQKLNLQDRFLSRLNALASDRELSELLKNHFASLPEASEQPFEENADAEENADETMDWEAQEIVVDDQPETEETNPPSILSDDENADLADTGLLLPSDEPVPTPQLQLPPGELTAGRSVKLLVRLPELAPRIYVKLWIHDRQTRTVLDGPHWITDFWATGMGDMEATMQLLIPYGTVEIELDAIAVEMQTEREGRKVTISAPVAPPTPPSLPLDDA